MFHFTHLGVRPQLQRPFCPSSGHIDPDIKLFMTPTAEVMTTPLPFCTATACAFLTWTVAPPSPSQPLALFPPLHLLNRVRRLSSHLTPTLESTQNPVSPASVTTMLSHVCNFPYVSWVPYTNIHEKTAFQFMAVSISTLGIPSSHHSHSPSTWPRPTALPRLNSSTNSCTKPLQSAVSPTHTYL